MWCVVCGVRIVYGPLKYGDAKLIQSHERTGKVWTHVKDVDASKVYQTVTLRGGGSVVSKLELG